MMQLRSVPSLLAVVLPVVLSVVLLLGSGCPAGGGHGTGGRGTGAKAEKREPRLKLLRFDGRKGAFRIRNDTGRRVRQIAIGIRGYECEGPKPTVTLVRVFDAKLRSGRSQSYGFDFQTRCKRPRIAIESR
ncbi:MAG: hypothetical protein ABI333_29195 [bacterium]